MAFNSAKGQNYPKLSPLISCGVMQSPTAENIAGSGLKLVHLKMLINRDGKDAMIDLF